MTCLENLDLYRASARGDTDKMEDAIEKGADLEWRNNKDFYNTALLKATKCQRINAVSLLLKRGALIDSHDNSRATSLYWVSFYGNHELVELLVQHGADIEKANAFGKTALMVAASQGHPSCVRILLESGADLDKTDVDGMCAMCHAQVGAIVNRCQGGGCCDALQILKAFDKRGLSTKRAQDILDCWR